MSITTENFSYATFISLNPGNSTGSGFMLSLNEKKYIITAKHVLFNNEKLRCESILITSQNHLGEIEDAETIVIDDLENIKIFKSEVFDIAAIELDNEDSYRIEQEGKNIITIQETDIDSLENIKIANNILLVGFPTSLIVENSRFFDVNRPLLRKGIIAGINIRDNT
ncbi:MAG TPA: hypothetical protein PKV22_02165, partial [Paludibacteraceae bacterium]|nr:hypothetical protein [Paludibacteraceae bacterium]